MSKNVVIIDHRQEIADILGLNLAVYAGLEIKVVSNYEEIKDPGLEAFLEEKADLYLIHPSCEFLKDLQANIKDSVLVSLGGPGDFGGTPLEEDFIISEPYTIKNIIRKIALLLKITAKEMAGQKVDEFFLMPSLFVQPDLRMDFDLFEKIEGDLEISLFDGEVLGTTDKLMMNLRQKDFFIPAKERLFFVNSITEQIISRSDDPSLSLKENMLKAEDTQKSIFKMVEEMGIDDNAQRKAMEGVTTMQNICSNIPKLNQLLERLNQNQHGFLYKHSMLTNFIGTHILRAFDWVEPRHFTSFNFACFFHDSALTIDSFHKFETSQEVKSSNLTDEEKNLVLTHAKLAADLVANFPKAPPGAVKLIREHHGHEDGKSMGNMTNTIDRLAAIFILAEEWATQSLEFHAENKKMGKRRVIELISKKYTHSVFKKFIPVISQLDI